ncbi:hypothetical protein IWQ62_005883 [Dispira parvispora]|uniref:Uncharacterized protein n=1 Tax=Dispira parvispora TaxID=1520584 RepID=A0A9W8AQ56_9FUNG|nr:hypothetical protein IWQ62_005883 [Dispira parvispora]
MEAQRQRIELEGALRANGDFLRNCQVCPVEEYTNPQVQYFLQKYAPASKYMASFTACGDTQLWVIVRPEGFQAIHRIRPGDSEDDEMDEGNNPIQHAYFEEFSTLLMGSCPEYARDHSQLLASRLHAL